MQAIKNLIAKFLGKQAGSGISVSKTKLSAVVFVLVIGIQELSKAWGHPILIPDYILQFLGAAGLWSLRDSIKS